METVGLIQNISRGDLKFRNMHCVIHNFILDEEALNEILNKDNIKDKPICIISVAGDGQGP